MTEHEVSLLQPGNKVVPLIGPYKGHVASVFKVELNAGAYNGWVTVRFIDGTCGMYAGEELQRGVNAERDKLRPCVFCGERLRLEMHVGLADYYIQCQSCSVIGPGGIDEECAVLQWNKREEIEKLRTELNQIAYERDKAAIGRTGAQIVFNKNPEGSSPIVIVSKWRADVMGGPAIQEQTTMIKPGEGIDLSLVGLESEEVTKLRTENEKLRAEMEKARIAFVRASGRLFDINLPGEVVRDVEKILDEALRSIDESGLCK